MSQKELPITNTRLPATSVASGVWIALATVVVALGMAPASGVTRQATTTPEPAVTNLMGALPWEIPEDGERMVVHKVVDGDTLQLTYPDDDWYYSTRLIGIQAPEMAGPYTRQGCYGSEAREFLNRLLPVGTEVIVQKDITDEDRNGRRLRHVFLLGPGTSHRAEQSTKARDAYLLSEVLVLGGFAEARTYPPDDLYDDILEEAEKAARGRRAGLWRACAA